MGNSRSSRLPLPALLYICLMAVGFCYGAWGMPWYMRHLTQLILVVFGALFLVLTGKTQRLGLVGTFSSVFALPYLAMLAFSMVCWALDLRPVNYITRGCSTLCYCLISYAAMGVAVMLFGVKAADYTFYGMCLANLGIIAYSVRLFGIKTLASEFLQYVISGGIVTPPSVKVLEVHDLTFAFGLMALYYLLFAKERRKHSKKCGAAALVFFAVGWKLIGVLGFGAALAAFWLLRRQSEHTLRRMVPLLAAAALAIFGGYLYCIFYGQFDAAIERFGIDTRGRTALYDSFRNYYTFSPLFRGYGIGYATRTVTILTRQGTGIFGTHSFGGLHNDILTLYIELGFWGFVLWVWHSWHSRILHVWRHFGRGTALLLLCQTVYAFVTYTTDNTVFYCYINTIFMLLPMAYAAGELPEKGEGANASQP